MTTTTLHGYMRSRSICFMAPAVTASVVHCQRRGQWKKYLAYCVERTIEENELRSSRVARPPCLLRQREHVTTSDFGSLCLLLLCPISFNTDSAMFNQESVTMFAARLPGYGYDNAEVVGPSAYTLRGRDQSVSAATIEHRLISGSIIAANFERQY